MLFGLAVAVMTLSSCGSSVEKDAKKAVDLTCESIELSLAGVEQDDPKMKKIEEKAMTLKEELDKKYPEGSKEREEFEAAIEKEIENCKAYQDFINSFKDAFDNMELDDFDFDDMEWKDADWGDEEF